MWKRTTAPVVVALANSLAARVAQLAAALDSLFFLRRPAPLLPAVSAPRPYRVQLIPSIANLSRCSTRRRAAPGVSVLQSRRAMKLVLMLLAPVPACAKCTRMYVYASIHMTMCISMHSAHSPIHLYMPMQMPRFMSIRMPRSSIHTC